MKTPPLQPVVNWFIQDFEMFGLHGQNWMPAFALVLVAYATAVIIAERIERRLHPH